MTGLIKITHNEKRQTPLSNVVLVLRHYIYQVNDYIVH